MTTPFLAAEPARLLRFALVGGAGFLVDAGLLAFIHNGLGLDPFSARVLSIAAAALATWRLNRSVTFAASPDRQIVEGLRYGLVAALAAGMNYALYATALLMWPGLPPVLAVVIATILAMGFSYAGYSRFVFQGGRPAALARARQSTRGPGMSRTRERAGSSS